MLTREEFLRKKPRKTKEITVTDGTMLVRAMTAGERALFEASGLDREGKPIPERVLTFRERLAVATCVDVDGNLLFTDADIPALTVQLSADLDTIADAAQELARMDKRSREDLAGNSVGPPTPNTSAASKSAASTGSSDTSPSKLGALTG